MKREIVCLPCGAQLRKIIMPSSPNEYHKFVRGNALGNYLCDFGNEQIQRGQECEAFSVWTNAIPYTAWESNYVQEDTPDGD